MTIPWRADLGPEGARRAADRGDVVVVVDVLSFTTAAATAASRGAAIHPCPPGVDPGAFAAKIGGVAAVRREDVPERGRYSLSPLTYLDAPPGERIVVASPNGAICASLAARAPAVLAGALVNAKATARAALSLGLPVTVLASCERDRGGIRFALEDWLGAGAILSSAAGSGIRFSGEAEAALASFRALEARLEAVLLDSESGRELAGRGFEDDVRHAARLDLHDAPVFFERAS